ncbi:PAS domain S-box protein [Candidatus Bathyarchaeota archaeon]|nr:PAS domain S-box protein [Candidatus Bathyarchaeota archaeon]
MTNTSEQDFRSLVENAAVPIATTDLKGRFTYVNKALAELLGYTVQELLGRPFKDFLHPAEKGKITRLFLKSILLRRQPRNFEFKAIHRNGHVLYLMSKPTKFVVNGKTVGFQAIIVNITKRKEVEKCLEETNKKLEMLFETAMEGITIVDTKENLTFVNKAFADMLGYRVDELKHMNLRELVDEKTFYEIRKQTEYRKKGAVNRYEIIMHHKDGKPRIVQVSASPFWNEDGGFAGSMAITMDITEHKQMLGKLEEYSQQLEELVEKKTRQLKEAQEKLVKSERLVAIGQVSSMIGHDLRNPLTGIAGATYYLKKKLASKIDDVSREMLELIEENVKYSNKIINDLLEYSREITLKLTETTPKAIIHETLALVKVPNHIQVLDNTDTQLKVRLDADKMKRVFVNIVKNAVDAMPNGGTLKITSSQKDGNLQIVFSDTGTGIPNCLLEKIWTPFFTTKAKGMGLGLPICKRIVEAHEGSISTQSSLGKGTTFTIILPIKPKIKGGDEKVWVSEPKSLLSTTTKA